MQQEQGVSSVIEHWARNRENLDSNPGHGELPLWVSAPQINPSSETQTRPLPHTVSYPELLSEPESSLFGERLTECRLESSHSDI